MLNEREVALKLCGFRILSDPRRRRSCEKAVWQAPLVEWEWDVLTHWHWVTMRIYGLVKKYFKADAQAGPRKEFVSEESWAIIQQRVAAKQEMARSKDRDLHLVRARVLGLGSLQSVTCHISELRPKVRLPILKEHYQSLAPLVYLNTLLTSCGWCSAR